MRVAISVESDNGWESPVAYRFARAPFFAIVEIDHGKAKSISIVQNPHMYVGRGAGPSVAQWLSGMGVSIVIAPHVGPNASMALSALGIEVRISPPGTPVRKALEMHGFSV